MRRFTRKGDAREQRLNRKNDREQIQAVRKHAAASCRYAAESPDDEELSLDLAGERESVT